MFSGIIEQTTNAKKIEKTGNSLRLHLKLPKGWKVKKGESISIDGICSTVESLKDGKFGIYYMPETLRKVATQEISMSHLFNLERSLTLQSLIGGHLVSGHIDTTAQLFSIKKEQDSKVMKFKINQKYTKYIIEKGSIAINGVSLTIISVGKDYLSISLIPYTLKNTNLGELEAGNLVNIELDMIAKYLEKLKT